MKIKRENISFILLEPQYPGNIGAAARALKTMGFQSLVLINPGDFHAPEAKWMAHASEDILNDLIIKDSLKKVVVDFKLVIATTQRTREFHLPFFTPPELARKIIPISQNNKIAIVFGREHSGLTNDELRLCHISSTIPASVKHPSLNLAQAVMIYCYEFYNQSFEAEKKYSWKYASYNEIESVFEHLRKSLTQVNFKPKDNWPNFLMRFRRLFTRALPEVRDVKLIHKILQAFDEYVVSIKGKTERK
jgi:TrmH family RNA methyltransferase